MSRSPYRQPLAELIAGRETPVVVVGLGYVGLPLAVAVAAAGFPTIGIDQDRDKVKALWQGRSYIPDVESAEVERLVAHGRLAFSTDYADAATARVALVAVPTPIDGARVPDLCHVEEAATGLARIMPASSLVVLESTVYPGATEEVLAPAFAARGRSVGREIFLAYSPERIDPGNPTWNLGNTPKIVAGLTKDCLELAIAFYGAFVDQLVPVSNVRTAETAKLFENTFRMVNIAMVNEFQVICDAFGIDVWEALGACKTKPYGFMAFQPGPGLGGHCIPVDPFYLAWKAREKHVSTEFIDLAGRVNDAMPAYVVGLVARLLNAQQRAVNGSRIALLGASYKRNSSDLRESPALRIIELLLEAGATVTYHDPHAPSLRHKNAEMISQPLTVDYLDRQDCVVVVTDHDAIDWTLVMEYAPKVIDSRNALGRLQPQGAPAVMGARERARLSVADRLDDPERESA